MDGFDDLAVVDALQVDRGEAEIAVAKLALDDDQRHAFASELDGVRVPELVRREAPTDAGRDGGPAQLRSGSCTSPVPASRGSVDDAEQRSDRQPDPQLEPRAKLLPGLFVHRATGVEPPAWWPASDVDRRDRATAQT